MSPTHKKQDPHGNRHRTQDTRYKLLTTKTLSALEVLWAALLYNFWSGGEPTARESARPAGATSGPHHGFTPMVKSVYFFGFALKGSKFLGHDFLIEVTGK